MKKCVISFYDSSIKILRNEKPNNTINDLSFNVLKNEQVGFQMVLTPTENAEYDVSLTSENANVTDFFKIYSQKYIHVKEHSVGHEKCKLGFYPDAIVSIELAKKYSENTVKANENQGIWVLFCVPKDFNGSLINAELNVKVGNETESFSITVNVEDYALTQTNHLKQMFNIGCKHLLKDEGSLDYDLYRLYYEQCLEYRINGSKIPTLSLDDGGGNVDEFLSALNKYYKDERISVINIPEFYNKSFTDIVEYEYFDFFVKLIKKCISDKTNYFKKLVNYMWVLDEPHLAKEREGYVRKILPKLEEIKRQAIENVLKTEKINSVIIKSLFNMPNVITCGFNANILPEDNEYKITYCPAFGVYAQKDSKFLVSNVREKWWYGCDWPVHPFFNYHIDESLLSPRLLSWGQYKSGIKGNLYWRLNFHGNVADENNVFATYELANPYPSTNGEGFLVYPGKPYGVKGFIPSIRLLAIKFGIQEYETLLALEYSRKKLVYKTDLKCQKLKHVLLAFFDKLFVDNVKLTDNAESEFKTVRESVFWQLHAVRKYGFTITEVNFKTKTVKVFSENVKFDCDCEISDNGNKTFTIKCDKDQINFKLYGENETVNIPFVVKRRKVKENYALLDCAIETVDKYKIKGYSAYKLAKPFFDRTKNDTTNKSAIELSNLIRTVYRTKCVIIPNGNAIKVYVPDGRLLSSDPVKTEIKGDLKIYTIKTDADFVTFEIETAKDKYGSVVYLGQRRK